MTRFAIALLVFAAAQAASAVLRPPFPAKPAAPPATATAALEQIELPK